MREGWVLDLDGEEFEGFWGLRDGSCSVLSLKKKDFWSFKGGFWSVWGEIKRSGILGYEKIQRFLESESIVLFCFGENEGFWDLGYEESNGFGRV